MSLEELIGACAERGDAAAWQAFVHEFQPLIAGVASRMCSRFGAPASTVDDLIQETYLRICEDRRGILEHFRRDDPQRFYGYLKVIAANVARDHFRAKLSLKRGSGRTESPSESETLLQSEFHVPMDGTELLDRKILIQQIDKFLREATVGRGSKRDLTIFWLYYRVGLTASAIASLPCVALSTKGVESILHRLTALVRECLVKNGEPGVIQKDSPSNQRS